MLLSSSLNSFLQLIGVLVIFVVVLLMTWLVTRWLGGMQKSQMRNKNLNLVETIRVGNNKLISIVKAGKKYFVVSIGKDEVHLIGELSADDFTDLSSLSEGGAQGDSFSEILSKFKDKFPGTRDKNE